MKARRTIGRLAQESRVPISTLRYYERRGLLPLPGRTEGNYRTYDEHAVARVRFIRAAQDAGFTLEDIHTLLEVRSGDRVACGRIRPIVLARLADVDRRLRELRGVQETLSDLASACVETRDDDPCPSIDRIASPKPRND